MAEEEEAEADAKAKGETVTDMTPPEFDNAMEHREWLIQKRVEEAVQKVYQLAWSDDLSAAESRLVWMRVIKELVESTVLEKQTVASAEWMGIKV